MSKQFVGRGNGGYNPNTYVSIQDRVNSDPTFRSKYFKELGETGWDELEDPTDILKLPSNTQIKYILNSNKRKGPGDFGFRSGGFYQRPGEDGSFIYYKGFNKNIFKLSFGDITNLYIKQRD